MDDIVAVVDPPQEIVAVVEKGEVIKLDSDQADKLPTLDELKAFFNIGAIQQWQDQTSHRF